MHVCMHVCVCLHVCYTLYACVCMHTCMHAHVHMCECPSETVHTRTCEQNSDLHDFCLFVRGKQVGHFSGVEEVVDVFQEGLLLDLRVCDQEHCGLALGACVLQQVLVEYHRQAHVVH